MDSRILMYVARPGRLPGEGGPLSPCGPRPIDQAQELFGANLPSIGLLTLVQIVDCEILMYRLLREGSAL